MRLYFILLSVLISSCSVFCPNQKSGHDPQFIQIFYHFGKFNELDTFNGTFQKDLIPGTIRTTMWLTTVEQDTILYKIKECGFFELPDTIYRKSNTIVSPNLGPKILRIKYNNLDKTVVWYFPIDSKSKFKHPIEKIQEMFYKIIYAKPEYKALPRAKGAYL